MFSHHSDEMCQMSKVSEIALWRYSINVFVIFIAIVFVFVVVFLLVRSTQWPNSFKWVSDQGRPRAARAAKNWIFFMDGFPKCVVLFFIVAFHPHCSWMLLHHWNWPVLPLMGGRRGSLGPGWTHYLMAPGWPQLTSLLCHLQVVLKALNLTLCLSHPFVLFPPFWGGSTMSGSSVFWAFYYSNKVHQSLSWWNSMRQG